MMQRGFIAPRLGPAAANIERVQKMLAAAEAVLRGKESLLTTTALLEQQAVVIRQSNDFENEALHSIVAELRSLQAQSAGAKRRMHATRMRQLAELSDAIEAQTKVHANLREEALKCDQELADLDAETALLEQSLLLAEAAGREEAQRTKGTSGDSSQPSATTGNETQTGVRNRSLHDSLLTHSRLFGRLTNRPSAERVEAFLQAGDGDGDSGGYANARQLRALADFLPRPPS